MFARERACISGTSHPSPAVAVHIQRRCEALPTMHCDLGATLYIIDFSALVAHCSAGLRSVRRSVN